MTKEVHFGASRWIWLDSSDGSAYSGGVNTYVRFFDKLHAAEKSGRYTLRISVDTNYALYINGRLAATGQYADYPFDKVYDELDVTEYIVSGENSIVIDCYHQGDDSSTVRGETAGLIYELTDERDCVVIGSREDVLAVPNDRYAMGASVEHVSGQLGYSFRYDSTVPLMYEKTCITVDKPMPVRNRPVKKLIIGDNEPAMLTVHGYFTEETGGTVGQRMQYASLAFTEGNVQTRLPSEDGCRLTSNGRGDGVFALIDTGRENAGILSLDIEVTEEAEILIGWGEHLEDMRVRSYVGGRNFAASYRAHPGRNIFVNPFRRLGMRYLELHIYAPDAVIRYAGIKTTDYPMQHDIVFECADKLHTKIHDVCKRTLLMSVHEHYEDCPWREQALYSMDSRNQMLCGYYVFCEFDFAKASIRLIAQSIREDDLLELCSPARVSITIPSFSAIFLTQVYEYLEYSGDSAFALEMLPYMKRIADGFIARLQNSRRLIECYTEEYYWNFYEWQSGLEGSIGGSIREEDRTFDAPLSAFVSFGLRSLADTLDILGDKASAEYYRNEHMKLNRAIDEQFWDVEHGAYASYIDREGNKRHYAELTNSLIVFADAAHDERLDCVLEALANKKLIPVTLSHSIFKYEAMMRDPEKYARTVFDDIAEKWGYMLYNNATTFWETIDGAKAFGNAGSLCHGWSAVPIFFYHKYAMNMDGSKTGLYECRTYESFN